MSYLDHLNKRLAKQKEQPAAVDSVSSLLDERPASRRKAAPRDGSLTTLNLSSATTRAAKKHENENSNGSTKRPTKNIYQIQHSPSNINAFVDDSDDALFNLAGSSSEIVADKPPPSRGTMSRWFGSLSAKATVADPLSPLGPQASRPSARDLSSTSPQVRASNAITTEDLSLFNLSDVSRSPSRASGSLQVVSGVASYLAKRVTAIFTSPPSSQVEGDDPSEREPTNSTVEFRPSGVKSSQNLFEDEDDDTSIAVLKIKKGNTMTINRRRSGSGSNSGSEERSSEGHGSPVGGLVTRAQSLNGTSPIEDSAGTPTRVSCIAFEDDDSVVSPDPRRRSGGSGRQRGARTEKSPDTLRQVELALSMPPPPLPPPKKSTKSASLGASKPGSVGRRTTLLEPASLDPELEVLWLRRSNDYLFDLLPQEVKEENFDDSAAPSSGLAKVELTDDLPAGGSDAFGIDGPFTVKVGVDLYKRIFADLDVFTMAGNSAGCVAVSQLVDTLLKLRVKRVHASLLTTYLPQTVNALKYTYPALADPANYPQGPQRRRMFPACIPITIPPSLAEAAERLQRIEDLLGVLVAPCDEVSFVGIVSFQQRLQENIAEQVLATRFFGELVRALRGLKDSATDADEDDMVWHGGDIFKASYHSHRSSARASTSIGRGARSLQSPPPEPMARQSGKTVSPPRNTVTGQVAANADEISLSPYQAAQVLWQTLYESIELILTHHPNVGLMLHAFGHEKLAGLLCQGLAVRYLDWAPVTVSKVQNSKKRSRSVGTKATIDQPPAPVAVLPSPKRTCATLINKILTHSSHLVVRHFTYQISVFDAAWHCLLPPLYQAEGGQLDISLQQEMLEGIEGIIRDTGDEIRSVLFVGSCGHGQLPPAGARDGYVEPKTSLARGDQSGPRSESRVTTRASQGFVSASPIASSLGKDHHPHHSTTLRPVDHFSIGIQTASSPSALLTLAAYLLEPQDRSARFGQPYVSFHYAILVAVHNRLLRACGLAEEDTVKDVAFTCSESPSALQRRSQSLDGTKDSQKKSATRRSASPVFTTQSVTTSSVVRSHTVVILDCCKYLSSVCATDSTLLTLKLPETVTRRGSNKQGGEISPSRAKKVGQGALPMLEGLIEALEVVHDNTRRQGMLCVRVGGLLNQLRTEAL